MINIIELNPLSAKKDESFIGEVKNICKRRLFKPVSDFELRQINFELDSCVNKFLMLNNIEHPGWKADCILEPYYKGQLIIRFSTLDNQFISVFDIEDYLETHGYRS